MARQSPPESMHLPDSFMRPMRRETGKGKGKGVMRLTLGFRGRRPRRRCSCSDGRPPVPCKPLFGDTSVTVVRRGAVSIGCWSPPEPSLRLLISDQRARVGLLQTPFNVRKDVAPSADRRPPVPCQSVFGGRGMSAGLAERMRSRALPASRSGSRAVRCRVEQRNSFMVRVGTRLWPRPSRPRSERSADVLCPRLHRS